MAIINKLCFCLTQCICIRKWLQSFRPKIDNENNTQESEKEIVDIV